ncbi:hypothetical protein LTR95_004975 [Oleoguttula sp. CCFEE 5521]
MISQTLVVLLSASIVSAQYSVRWYSNPPGNAGFAAPACIGREFSLGCPDIPGYQCCEAPPGREEFIYVRVTSSGVPGVVAFHDTDSWGGCLGCTVTGTLNICYNNVPFETVSILPVNRRLCQTIGNSSPIWKRNGGALIGNGAFPKTDSIIPGTGGNASIPATCNKISMVTVNDVDYHLEDGQMQEEFMRDYHGPMGGDQFVEKYGLKPMNVGNGVDGQKHDTRAVNGPAGTSEITETIRED